MSQEGGGVGLTGTPDQVGETVVVEGRASPTAAGASVTTDERETFYVAGLDAWDPELELKRVRVSGVLRLRPATLAQRPLRRTKSTGSPTTRS